MKWLAAAVLMLVVASLSSCSDSKSYAEQLEDERRACNAYLASFEVINEIPKDTVFQTGADAPFYRIDPDGNVYMQVTIKVSCHNVNLLTASRILHERVCKVTCEAQTLATYQFYTWIGLAVQHPCIVLDQFHQILGIIEAAGIANPPVGLVLDRHRIDINTFALHPCQESVQPREEFFITVCTKFATFVTLISGITALCSTISLVFSRRRPRCTKHDTTTLFDNLS